MRARAEACRALALSLCMLAACARGAVDTECEVGRLGCTCDDDSNCRADLVCLSGVCVGDDDDLPGTVGRSPSSRRDAVAAEPGSVAGLGADAPAPSPKAGAAPRPAAPFDAGQDEADRVAAEPSATAGASSQDGRDAFAPDARASDAQTPDAQTPDAQTPDAQTPDAQTPDAQTPDAQPSDAQADLAGPDTSVESGTSAPPDAGADAFADATCSDCPRCGDGIVNADEACDPAAGGGSYYTCTGYCTLQTLYTSCRNDGDCLHGFLCLQQRGGAQHYACAPMSGGCTDGPDIHCPAPAQGATPYCVDAICALQCEHDTDCPPGWSCAASQRQQSDGSPLYWCVP